MASKTEIECAILAADGTYNAMGLHAQELGRIIRELEAERDELEEAGRIMLGEALGDEAMINRLQAERDELQAEVARLRDKLADASPQEPEPKRLTVEDLDAAEVGSRVSFSGSWLEKSEDGTWMGVKAEDIISMSPDRTLTPPEKPGYQKFYDSIGATDLLHRTTPPEPARRGRVVKPEELREGDVYDVWYRDTFQGRQRHVSVGPLDAPGWEFRLISRKPPEPEDHPIILIHETDGDGRYEPAEAAFWADKGYEAKTGFWDKPEVLDWSPARVVPAGQEGQVVGTDTNTWSCWVAYYPDYSNVFVFSTEIEALRYAVEHDDMRVKQMSNGEELR